MGFIQRWINRPSGIVQVVLGLLFVLSLEALAILGVRTRPRSALVLAGRLAARVRVNAAAVRETVRPPAGEAAHLRRSSAQ